VPAVSEAAEGLEDLDLERVGLALEQAHATRAFTKDQVPATTEAQTLGAVHEEGTESVLMGILLGCR